MQHKFSTVCHSVRINVSSGVSYLMNMHKLCAHKNPEFANKREHCARTLQFGGYDDLVPHSNLASATRAKTFCALSLFVDASCSNGVDRWESYPVHD